MKTCTECGYVSQDETTECNGCKGLDEYLENWGKQRWEQSQSWDDFWVKCEEIKGKR